MFSYKIEIYASLTLAKCSADAFMLNFASVFLLTDSSGVISKKKSQYQVLENSSQNTFCDDGDFLLALIRGFEHREDLARSATGFGFAWRSNLRPKGAYPTTQLFISFYTSHIQSIICWIKFISMSYIYCFSKSILKIDMFCNFIIFFNTYSKFCITIFL